MLPEESQAGTPAQNQSTAEETNSNPDLGNAVLAVGQSKEISGKEQHDLTHIFAEKAEPIRIQFESICQEMGIRNGVSLDMVGENAMVFIDLTKSPFGKVII